MFTLKQLLLCSLCFALSCERVSQTNGARCATGFIIAGERCIPLSPRVRVDRGNFAPSLDARVEEVPPDRSVERRLPLFVDEHFAPSGYMGDGEQGGIQTVPCTQERAEQSGVCHGFQWTPGEQGWAGIFWQHPDGNWGDAEGFQIPAGAQSIRFSAWGAAGGEVITFGAGIGEVDGFAVTSEAITLNPSPTDYVIDLSGVDYDRVVGAFSWAMGDAAAPQVIFIDQIRWSEEPTMTRPDPTPVEPMLPLAVDDWFAPSGYMGDGSMQGVVYAACEEEAETTHGLCHRFAWTPGAQGWAGVYWQYPDGNWGEMPGLEIPAGARSVRFTAWGERGDEVVTFGVGMEEVDGFTRSRAVTLSEVPTQFEISLDDVTYDEVVGAFVWTADTAADESLTFYLKEIHWSEEAAAPSDPDPMPAPEGPVPLPLEVADHFIPAGYMGEVMSISPVDCPLTPNDAPCAGFDWSPAGTLGWGGVVWQSPAGNWGAEPGLEIEAGATAIQFTAWGALGGEVISFGAGYGTNSDDGFDVSSGELTLTAEPMRYELPLNGVDYQQVASGFRWTTESEQSASFFVGDIQWVR